MVKFVFSLIVNIFKLIDVGVVSATVDIIFNNQLSVTRVLTFYAAVMHNYVILHVAGTRV